MYDNGLLKHYKELSSRNGFLNLSQLNSINNFSTLRGAAKNTVDGKSFYIKNITGETIRANDKLIYDVEILLSQIYARAGLNTTVYLPATSNGKSFLISNDVSSPEVIHSATHMYPLFGTKVTDSLYLNSFPFLIKDQSQLDEIPSLPLSKQVMQEQTIMRILDVASHNSDRHYLNFFYKLSQSTTALQKRLAIPETDFEDFRYFTVTLSSGTKPDEVEDPLELVFDLKSREEILDYYHNYKTESVVSIDYGESGNVLRELSKSGMQYEDEVTYFTDFNFRKLTSKEFKREIQENEELSNLLNKAEVAETIGSLNPQGVAQDIKDTIGYTIDSSVVSILAESYDNMAETLLQ